MKLDLNCDLGEGEPVARTRALMKLVSSANVACGGHAGTFDSMDSCVRLAKELHVQVGAHPGPWSRSDRGRGTVGITPPELDLLLLHQVSALDGICRKQGLRLHHIKLHGTLYHLTEQNPVLGERYLRTVRRWWPGSVLYVRAGGELARRARRLGATIWEEAFADRGYRPDGTLVPRDQPGALLTDVAMITERVRALLLQHGIKANDGSTVPMRPRTLCVHSDTPNSLRLVRTISRLLHQP